MKGYDAYLERERAKWYDVLEEEDEIEEEDNATYDFYFHD